MRMATMELRLDALTHFSRETDWRVPVEPTGTGGAYVVTALAEGPVPLIPGDVLEAENGRVTRLLRSSQYALVSIMPTLDHLQQSERYNHLDHFENVDHRSLLMRLEDELQEHCVEIRDDALFLTAVLEDEAQLRSIEAHPLVFGVDIIRYPGGIVHSHPNRIVRGDAEPMTLDWVREFTRSQPEAEDYGRWPRGFAPDTIPEDWS